MRALWLLLCLLSGQAWAGTKFIDLAGTGSGAADGSSVNDQCAGLSDVDCAEAAGNTYYLCNAAASGTDVDVPAAGTSESARIDYDFSCPGGTPGSLTSGRVVGTGFDYWGVSNATINASDSGQSAIACFVCQTSYGGSCSSREGTCKGFRATNNTIIDAGKHAIEIGTVANHTAYDATTGVVITGNTITDPRGAGVSMNANMVLPTEGNNTVTGANAGALNLWGVYTSPRAYNYANGASWVTAGFTCGGGSFTQYKVTLGSGTLTSLGAAEIVKQVIVSGTANGHYATQSAAGCNPGSGLGSRRWCQDGSDLHVCGTELNPPTDNDVVIVTSDYGPVNIGRGDVITGTLNNGGLQDGVGIGSDIGGKNVTIEGAFSANNQGRGVEFNMCPTGCVAKGNIAINNGSYGFLANNDAAVADTVSWYNNVSAFNGSEPFRISNNGSTTVQAYNNIAIGTGSQNCVNTTVGGGEGGNFYLDCTATNFPTAITGDPGWRGGDSPTTAADFCLDPTSLLLYQGQYIGAWIYGYGGESLANPPPIGARGLCLGRRPAESRRAAGARVAN